MMISLLLCVTQYNIMITAFRSSRRRRRPIFAETLISFVLCMIVPPAFTLSLVTESHSAVGPSDFPTAVSIVKSQTPYHPSSTTSKTHNQISLSILSWFDSQNNYHTTLSSSFSSLTLASAQISGPDKVERILDGNTVQLQRSGAVRLAGVRMPSPTMTTNFEFPPCFTYSPSYKLRQLIPISTRVDVVEAVVQQPSSSSSSLSKSHNSNKQKKIPSVVLIRSDNALVINQELVRSGFAKAVKPPGRKQQQAEDGDIAAHPKDPSEPFLDYQLLLSLQEQAKKDGLGIFQRCPDSDNSRDKLSIDSDDYQGTRTRTAPFQAQFEPLERSIETVWTADGGRQQLRKNVDAADNDGERINGQPKNPGDVKSCSDFDTYEDSLQWFERYRPYFGDVAKLDRDGDGVPCPGLPHTTDRDKYRMKIPTLQKGGGRSGDRR